MKSDASGSVALRRSSRITVQKRSVSPESVPPPKAKRRKKQPDTIQTQIRVQDVPKRSTQNQSFLLGRLAAEIVDHILADPVLNLRDHVALSGTCSALRLGYNQDVWKNVLDLVQRTHKSRHGYFEQYSFTYNLLRDPCNASSAFAVGHSSPRSSTLAKDRIWTGAIAKAADNGQTGIDVHAICNWNPVHSKKRRKTCACMRVDGPSHRQVLLRVNESLVTWEDIRYHYKGLLDHVAELNVPTSRNDRYCLASVDSKVIRAFGGMEGVVYAMKQAGITPLHDGRRGVKSWHAKRRCACHR